MAGRFIAIEGVEGSGKSTLIRGLAARLESLGQEVVQTHEPGATPLGRELRAILLGTNKNSSATLDPTAELLLFAADRAQHLAEIVRPALKRGAWVLTDRFAYSTIAYQGYGRELGPAHVREVMNLVVQKNWPDAVLLLDLDPAIGLNRASARAGLDRMEKAPMTFHERVRHGFLQLAQQEPKTFIQLDAARSAGAVADEAWAELEKRFELVTP